MSRIPASGELTSGASAPVLASKMRTGQTVKIVYLLVCTLLMGIALIPFSPIFAYSGFLYTVVGKILVVSVGCILVGSGIVQIVTSVRMGQRPYMLVLATLMACYVAITTVGWYVLR